MDRMKSIDSLIAPCDVLLIVPPFGPLDRPCLGVHVLQACARAAGFRVSVFYANIWFAQWIGEQPYKSLLGMPQGWLLGERLFTRFAFGTPPLGHDGAANVVDDYLRVTGQARESVRGSLRQLLEVEEQAGRWLATGAPMLAQACPAIVGTTSMFEQTAPGLALLRALARERPDTVRIVGGANCEGEMAEGVQAIAPFVNFVFSGESEASFVAFLREHAEGRLPQQPIVQGSPCQDLDALPTPDFAEYFQQFQAFIPDSPTLRNQQCCLPYESSRGCWWGQKSHCTFCGLNGEGMGFRQKSPDRVLEELWDITAQYPGQRLAMTDNIMPHQYFRALLPRIRDELPALNLFYELKSNLTLDQVRVLAEAGVNDVQPGIEALSSGLLALMKKGSSVAHSIATLRYARVFDMTVRWHVLYGFPGDELAYYLDTLELLPLLRHLPPSSITARPVVISRFSPYFDRPEHFGISAMRPFQAYRDVLPADAPADKVAYFFDCDFASASLQYNDVIPAIQEELGQWVRAWQGPRTARPVLHVAPRGDAFELRDTRGLNSGPIVERIDHQQAEVALTGRLPDDNAVSLVAWAHARKVIIERDGKRIPLATADYQLLKRMEEGRSPADAPTTIPLTEAEHVVA